MSSCTCTITSTYSTGKYNLEHLICVLKTPRLRELMLIQIVG